MGKHDAWLDEEDKILKDNYGILKYKEISDLMRKELNSNRTAQAIRTRACLLNLTNPKKPPNWSQKELEILKKYHDTKPYSQISIILKKECNTDRNVCSIYHMSKKLKLKTVHWWEKDI